MPPDEACTSARPPRGSGLAGWSATGSRAVVAFRNSPSKSATVLYRDASRMPPPVLVTEPPVIVAMTVGSIVLVAYEPAAAKSPNELPWASTEPQVLESEPIAMSPAAVTVELETVAATVGRRVVVAVELAAAKPMPAATAVVSTIADAMDVSWTLIVIPPPSVTELFVTCAFVVVVTTPLESAPPPAIATPVLSDTAAIWEVAAIVAASMASSVNPPVVVVTVEPSTKAAIVLLIWFEPSATPTAMATEPGPNDAETADAAPAARMVDVSWARSVMSPSA